MEQPKVKAHHSGGENRRRDGLSHLDSRSRSEAGPPLAGDAARILCSLDFTPHYDCHLVYGNPGMMVVLLL